MAETKRTRWQQEHSDGRSREEIAREATRVLQQQPCPCGGVFGHDQRTVFPTDCTHSDSDARGD